MKMTVDEINAELDRRGWGGYHVWPSESYTIQEWNKRSDSDEAYAWFQKHMTKWQDDILAERESRANWEMDVALHDPWR